LLLCFAFVHPDIMRVRLKGERCLCEVKGRSLCWNQIVIDTGLPRVFLGYPYPYPPKPVPTCTGRVFGGYGSGS
jgi:hypothetical protein